MTQHFTDFRYLQEKYHASIGFALIFVFCLILGLGGCSSGGGSGSSSNNTETPESTIDTVGTIRTSVATGSNTSGFNLWWWDASGQLIRVATDTNTSTQSILDLSNHLVTEPTPPAILLADTDPPLSILLPSIPENESEIVANLNPIGHAATAATAPQGLIETIITEIDTADSVSNLSITAHLQNFDLTDLNATQLNAVGRQLMDQLNGSVIPFSQYAFVSYTYDLDLPDIYLQMLLSWDTVSANDDAFRVSRPTLDFPFFPNGSTTFDMFNKSEFQARIAGEMIQIGLSGSQIVEVLRTLSDEQRQRIQAFVEAFRSTGIVESSAVRFFTHVQARMMASQANTEMELEQFLSAVSNSLSIAASLFPTLDNSTESVAEALGQSLGSDEHFTLLSGGTVLQESTLNSILTETGEQISLPSLVDASTLYPNVLSLIPQILMAATEGASGVFNDSEETCDPTVIPPDPSVSTCP